MTAALLIATAILLVVLILAGTARAADGLAMPAEETRRFTGRAGTMLLSWITFISLMGVTGVLADFPPAIAPVTLMSAVLFARSPVGRLLETLPFHLLVGFQSFRILAESFLYLRWKAGAIPVELTFDGSNFDVVTGILAFNLAFFLRRRPWRPLIWGFNVLGSALLVRIVALHVTLAPASVVHFPYVLLPGTLVWSAILGHVLVFQKLLARD